MDFHCMKRKELQALCKKHKIPAILSNQEMANRLMDFFKEQDENVTETESADAGVNRKVKKVRFSPEHELIEFTRSPKMRRSRRNSGLCRNSSLPVVNIKSSEMKKENLGGLDRVTRSGGLKSIEAKVNVKRRGRNAVKCDKRPNASTIEISDTGKLKEGHVDSSGRVILLRGKMLEVGEKNASKGEKKRVKDDDRRYEKSSDDDSNEKPTYEIVDNHGRVTRSRVQKLAEVHAKVEKRGRKEMGPFMNRGNVNSNGKLEVLEIKNIAGDYHVTEPQLLRKSKSNANMVAGSEILNVDTKKHDNGESVGLRKTSKSYALNDSGANGETGNEVSLDRRAVPDTEESIKVEPRRSNKRKNVIKSDELNAETVNRRTLRSSDPQLGISCEVSNGEKNVVQPADNMRRSRRKTSSLKLVPADKEADTGFAVESLEAETKNRRLLRSSVPRLELVVGAPKEEKKVLQPSGTIRRSRRKTFTDAAVENLKAEKIRNEPCLVEKDCSGVQKNTRRSRRIAFKCKSSGSPNEIDMDSVSHQKNQAMKRKRGVISGRGVVKAKNDPSSVAKTMKESSSKKAVTAAATGKIAYTTKRRRLNDFKLFDALLHNGLEREQFLSSAEASVSEGLGSTSNLGISINRSPLNIICDVELTSSKKAHRNKPDISIVDSARTSNMKLINGKELVNSDTKAASRTRELKTESTDSEGQTSVNIRGVKDASSPLKIDVLELIEENIKGTAENENEPETHVLTEDSNSKIVNQELPEDLNEGFDETGSSSDSLLIGDPSDNNVAEAEVDKCLQPIPCVVDNASVVQGICAQQNLEYDSIRQDNQVPPKVTKFSENEGFAETAATPDNLFLSDLTDIKTDVEVAEFDADKGLQLNPSVVGNLDSDETRQNNQVLPEGSNESGKEVIAQTDSSAGCPLLGDQTHIKTYLEVAEAEFDKYLERSPAVAKHVGEVKVTSIQNNLEYDGTRLDNQVLPEGSNVSGNKGIVQSDFLANNFLLGDRTEIKKAEADILPGPSNEGFAETNCSVERLLPDETKMAEAERDKCLEPSPSVVDHVGEVKPISVQENLYSGDKRLANDITSPFSCHHINDDHLEASSNILGNNNEGTSPKAGVVAAFDSCELAETSGDGCLNVHKSASYKYSELCVPDQSDCEGSAKIGPQDRVVCSGEYSVMNSEEQGKCKDSLGVASVAKSAEINLVRGHETDHTPRRDDTYNVLNSNLEAGKSVEGGLCKGHKSKYDEDGVFSVSNLFDTEGRPVTVPQDKKIISGEDSIKDFDELGMLHGSPSAASTTMCLFARELEADLIAEGIEAYICFDKQTEFSEAKGGSGCFKSHKSSKDEDWQFNISHLFEGEKSTRIPPQNREMISPNELVTFPDFASVSTTSANYNIAHSSNLQEISPSKFYGVSDTHAEQPKKTLAEPLAAANTGKIEEAWSNASETAGHGMCLLEANAEGNTSQVVEGSSADEEANATCGKNKEGFDGACLSNVIISTDCTISKIELDMKSQGTEETEQQQSKSLLAGQTLAIISEKPTDVDSIQSWTGIELHNLFATTLDNDTRSALSDISSQRTEIVNVKMSANKSISNNCGSLAKKKEKEVEGEIRSECEKNTDERVVSPSTFNEISHTGFDVDGEAPIKIVAPCKIDETCSHDTEFDRTVISVMECFEAMKENTEHECDEKQQDARYEIEKSSCLGDPLSDNEEDVARNGLNEFDRVDGSESSEEQLIENTGEHLKETNLITEADKEENVIDLGKSCLFYEAPDNGISMSASPRHLDKLEGCLEKLINNDLSKSLSCKSRVAYRSDGKITQNSEAASGLSDSDLQMSNLSEKSHHLTTCSEDVIIFGQASIETFRAPVDAELAKTGCFDGLNDVIGKGTSPYHILKASPDYGEVTERGDSIHTISDVPSSGCTEILKESDVDDAIKEYIDSETSLPMSFENSRASLPIDDTSEIDNAALCKYQEDVANSEGEDDMPLVNSLETESKGLEEATLVIDNCPGSEKAVNPPARFDSVAEGIDVKLDSQKQLCHRSPSRLLCSTAKKNVRTIMIHGTPGKRLTMADMKENLSSSKSSNVGDVTIVRPARRRALQDVHWK